MDLRTSGKNETQVGRNVILPRATKERYKSLNQGGEQMPPKKRHRYELEG